MVSVSASVSVGVGDGDGGGGGGGGGYMVCYGMMRLERRKISKKICFLSNFSSSFTHIHMFVYIFFD